MVSHAQYANRLIEWIETEDIIAAYSVYEDLVNNGFDYAEAFRVTIDLFEEE